MHVPCNVQYTYALRETINIESGSFLHIHSVLTADVTTKLGDFGRELAQLKDQMALFMSSKPIGHIRLHFANELFIHMNRKTDHILVRTEGMKLKQRPKHGTQVARNMQLKLP